MPQKAVSSATIAKGATGVNNREGALGSGGGAAGDGGKAKQDKRARDTDAEEQDKRQKQEKQTSQAGVGDEHDATVVERVGGGGGDGYWRGCRHWGHVTHVESGALPSTNTTARPQWARRLRQD